MSAIKSNAMEFEVEDLIECVRARPQIWDMTNREYKNRTIRPGIWKEIANELSEYT